MLRIWIDAGSNYQGVLAGFWSCWPGLEWRFPHGLTEDPILDDVDYVDPLDELYLRRQLRRRRATGATAHVNMNPHAASVADRRACGIVAKPIWDDA